jgi:Spirocyclase AveC-like
MKQKHITSVATPRRTPAVVIWAWIGAFFLANALYWIIAWMMSPDFVPTVPSPQAEAETPDLTKKLILFFEVGSSLTALFFFWLWFVKPKIQGGKVSFMGLLCLASLTSYALNPAENYYSYGIAYSSYLHNWGSWAFFIPGFSYPNQNQFPESPFMWGASFIWFNIALSLIFYGLWKFMDRRFPSMNLPVKIVILLVAGFCTDVIVETIAIRATQTYGYIGAIQKWSFFGGHWYQFPAFVGVITAVFWFGITSLMYYRDDKGHSWAERGADTLKISERGRTFVRFLALTGAIWSIAIVAYYIPIQWLYTHGDAFPEDTPHHLLNSHVLCGEHLGYQCPGPGVPIPRRDAPNPD